MAEYSPSFVQKFMCMCMWVNHVWDVYKISNSLELLFNGNDSLLLPFYDPLLAYITCICALLAFHSGYDVADL